MSRNAKQTIEELKKSLSKVKDGDRLFSKYTKVLTDDYLIEYEGNEVADDLQMVDRLSRSLPYLIKIEASTKQRWQIKLFKFGDTVSLSRGLPILENFGVKLQDERPYQIKRSSRSTIYICDFGVEVSQDLVDKIKDKKLLTNLQSAIVAVFNREGENDSLNKLVLSSGLEIRQVVLLRAITHYIAQTLLPFSKLYLADTLGLYPEITKSLFKLFDAKFNIKTHNTDEVKRIHKHIIHDLNSVTSLDHDRIINAYLSIIEAMLRTNYFQLDMRGNYKEYISFKLESAKLSPFLPRPLPLYEIFVYSRRFEAIHLRGGKVARGGLRWSDRQEDFRTEVLGLVKAQMVKNSVIVPTGSKGGFVCKKLPSLTNREDYMTEGINCYKTFISGLLDITDNLLSGKIIPPKNVIRYDGDDPYLVVAADKGTATFSDYANQMSKQYGFWLGDAFASGGSAGYDHKKMGITARGAWEATKRHFRHLGIDTQSQNFTVIGIGDMAGDVFGNGMLLSKHILLLAAFNHQHIFLDPNPDAATSFAERKRLFNLQGSSWASYNVKKISQGGGVFSRSLKTIPISKEVKKWLELTVNELSPNDLISVILRAKADLLYNGGIGTYIKAESESNEAVKDKANDALRVCGRDLQVKVVVEGGNVGVTQLGRIGFAKHGGLIYTDAIDNSAGVDCSDHEVNIKILFADVMQQTKMSEAKRNQILESMTDDVAALVLRDNYLQTQILSYASARSDELFSLNINFIERLEKHGELDRKVEFLPSYEECNERQRTGKGLTQPELAVLLAYSKMTLDHEILASTLCDNNIFDELLLTYFPKYLQDNYAKYINKHYLRREIIATSLANLIVNRLGITFVSRFEDEFRIPASSVALAFWIVYKLVDAKNLFEQIEALDNKIDADLQVQLFIRVKKSLERTVRLMLRQFKDSKNLYKDMLSYKDDVTKLTELLPKIIRNRDYPDVAALEEKFTQAKVPGSLVHILSRTNYLPQLLDIVVLARGTRHDLVDVAYNYFYIGRELRIDWLRKNLIALPENNKWQALSRSALLADGYTLYNSLVRKAIESTTIKDEHFASTWMKSYPQKIALLYEMLDELQSYKVLDLAMLSAALRELRSIFVD